MAQDISDCLSSSKPIVCEMEEDAMSAEIAGNAADRRHAAARLRMVARTMLGMCLHKMEWLKFYWNVGVFLNDERAGRVGWHSLSSQG